MRLKNAMQQRWRRQRMQEFCRRLRLQEGMRVLDLGGTPDIWRHVDLRLQLTILNLPKVIDRLALAANPGIAYVKGDACAAPFPDRAFDVVFSNSVIEHIPREKHAAFAENVMRLAPRWWVQTPSIRFPVEAHCNLPAWWLYPHRLKQLWIGHWRRAGNGFLAEQMSSTLGLDEHYYTGLFKGGEVYIEKSLGFEKSISIYAGDG